MNKFLRLLSVTAALVFCINASATDFTFKEGENKIVANDWVVNGTYTVQKTGKVAIDASSVFEIKCNGTTYECTYAPGALHGAYHYEVDAEAGQVITIINTFFMNQGTSVWITENGEGAIPIEVQQISPAKEKKYNWSRAGQMTINFNKAVMFDNIFLVARGKKYEVDDATAGSSIGCFLKNAISNAYSDGNMKEGDEFVVRIEGLCEMANRSNLYNGDGILEVKYLAPGLQGQMVSAKVNSQGIHTSTINNYSLLSYYDTDGEDGVMTFEFDKNVKSAESVKLRMGILDRSSEGLYYESNAPYTISGKTLTVDLRGELRSYARLFPGTDLEAMEVMGTEPFTTISLSLINILDEEGSPMYTPAQGSVGSYSFTFNFKEIQDNIVMDGDRDVDTEGRQKGSGDTVQLWIDQQVKSIDGMSIFFKIIDEGQGTDSLGTPIYVDREAVVAVSDIKTLSSDPAEGTVLSFEIPQLKSKIEEGGEEIEAAVGQALRIVLRVKTMNGMPHDLIINYIYGNATTSPTAIESTGADANSKKGIIYNLAGQRVSNNARGTLIIDGKKVLK